MIPIAQAWRSKCNTSGDQRMDNIWSALQRRLPAVQWQGPHRREAVIVAGGPSLSGQLDEVRRLKQAGAFVMAVNGAHDYLFRQDIAPDGMIMIDALPRKITLVQNPRDGVVYYIGSQCDPSIFDALAEHEVMIWHPLSGDMPVEQIVGDTAPCIGGGETAGLRAINLMIVLGYRSFHLFGFDSSFSDEQAHAYEQERGRNGVLPKRVEIHCGGRTFQSERWMATQVDHFLEFLAANGRGLNVTLYGDGLLQHAVETWLNRSAECHPSA